MLAMGSSSGWGEVRAALRSESTGIGIREWRVHPDTAALELADLDALVNERTRLVAFSHCSNIVGAVNDVAAVTRRVHEAGALVCVDGVAFAPHRRVDVKALGVDFSALSLYKIYGPHLALRYGRRRHLVAARGQC
ncbi:MAG: aminotransferase class V-fold PLP-dependent enzyme, partial [bacterium]|nr:aminotransferase class V-fold PLP-dependent enzyme [bacterium]